MKTLEELFNEIIESDELKKEFAEAAQTEEGVKAFLAKHDCPATFEEASAYVQEKAAEAKELGEAELDKVAGGSTASRWAWGAASVLSLGGCLFIGGIAAADSAILRTGALDCINTVTGILDD